MNKSPVAKKAKRERQDTGLAVSIPTAIWWLCGVVAGAIIGAVFGHVPGAGIGAVVGAVIGGFIGESIERKSPLKR
jgi:uncharacterized protein YcfJ